MAGRFTFVAPAFRRAWWRNPDARLKALHRPTPLRRAEFR